MLEKNIESKMQKTLETLESRLTTVRAGRANPAILNGITAEYYGVATPIQSLANITVPEAKQLFIKPFDKGALKEIEKSIIASNIGLAPINNGEIIILTVPELTEERRKEYVKIVKGYGEDAKVALRNIRQDANNDIKREEYSEDEEESLLNEVQELINKYNKNVDEMIKEKENELMTV